MKKIGILLLIGCLLGHPSCARSLKRGTSVIVRLTTTADSNRNTPVTAAVASDVIVAGEAVIIKGTPVDLSVDKRRAKGLGKPGYLQIGCLSTTAVDGQTIALSGHIEKAGDDRQGAAIGLGIGLGLTLLPFGGFLLLCLKGEKAELPAGTTIMDVSVAGNYTIDVSEP